MSFFVILPNQLFNKKYLTKKYKYIILEHPHYFEKYKYNKKKLLLHFASLRYYFDYLKKHKFDVKMVKSLTIADYYMFRPADKIKLEGKPIFIETPFFLLDDALLKEFRNKTDKFFFHSFYNFGKKKLNIIPDVKSTDKSNRKRMPKDMKIPPIPSNKNDYDYIKNASVYVNKNYKQNYGNTDDFQFPISHKTALKFLKHFVMKKFKHFGDYQDYIIKDESYLFHSILSTSLNIGLLTPMDVIKEIGKYKSKVPINSYEGFIRLLFWREYQNYCYIYYDFDNKNYFGNNKKLTEKWYNGKTGIEPVDDCIIKAFDTGYLHHIERLMIVGNYMNLSGIKPKEGYKWFMEFSCDSYEWVMNQNVLDMVFCVSGGETMRKPYISSSNYILKMSNYKKGEWSEKWDETFKQFIIKNKEKLNKFRYFFPFLKKY
jgi:deoxyribodipyrimidine photolyase-related protein